MFLKLESLQPTFSFKVRGATNAVARVIEEYGTDAPPLVTASAGNHGRALAHAASAAGLQLTVHVPASAPQVKRDAIAATGAVLVICPSYEDAERRAKAHAEDSGALFISPYSHPDVISGAGTAGLEIVQDLPDVDAVLVPVGGGGLIAGIATAVRGTGSTASIIGVEVEASCPFTQSLKAGRVVPVDVAPTLADGLAGNLDPDTCTFDLVRQLVSGIVLTGEADVREAIALLFAEERLIVEGAGAVGVAAMLANPARSWGHRVAVVLSGANIDPDVLKSLI